MQLNWTERKGTPRQTRWWRVVVTWFQIYFNNKTEIDLMSLTAILNRTIAIRFKHSKMEPVLGFSYTLLEGSPFLLHLQLYCVLSVIKLNKIFPNWIDIVYDDYNDYNNLTIYKVFKFCCLCFCFCLSFSFNFKMKMAEEMKKKTVNYSCKAENTCFLQQLQ